eukprot:851702-Rhodomonas_salina.1
MLPHQPHRGCSPPPQGLQLCPKPPFVDAGRASCTGGGLPQTPHLICVPGISRWCAMQPPVQPAPVS